MISKKRRVINKILNKFRSASINYERREYTEPETDGQEEIELNQFAQQNFQEPQIGLIEEPNTNRIPLPQQIFENVEIRKDVLVNLRNVNEIYPIVTSKTKFGQIPLAFAHIFYNPAYSQLQYAVVEPQIDAKLKKIISRTIQELHDRLEIDFNKVKNASEVYKYINKEIDKIWRLMGFKPNPYESIKIKYYVFREAVGLGKIEALTRDQNIEDISCDGVGLPIYIYHRNPLYGEMPTNIIFNEKEELDSFAMRLAQKCNRTISVSSPLMDGSLPDGSRVQVTLGTDIARRGSNFTIRKFFRKPLTPIDLITFGTANALLMAYLWLAIENEQSILISGTTATGKTTLLNVLSLFILPNLKIVSIEDTAEIQLPHLNWMPHVARAGFGATGYGEISMYDLLKAALRQRPDYLIVGEVRGKEANVLFQAMSTGHAGLSTIHADTINAVIDRLTTRPINLPVSLLENLDIIIFLEKTRRKDRLVRRISKVIEIEGYDAEKKQLKTNTAFEWEPVKDLFRSKDSYVLKQIADRTGVSVAELHNELMRRVKILRWMQKNNIYDFDRVSNIIQMYYINPQQLAKLMK